MFRVETLLTQWPRTVVFSSQMCITCRSGWVLNVVALSYSARKGCPWTVGRLHTCEMDVKHFANPQMSMFGENLVFCDLWCETELLCVTVTHATKGPTEVYHLNFHINILSALFSNLCLVFINKCNINISIRLLLHQTVSISMLCVPR